MNKSMKSAISLCAAAGFLIAVSSVASAQTAPATETAPAADAMAKPAAKPHKRAAPKASKAAIVVVTITNKRAVALTGLDGSQAGGELVTILSSLAPGKKATARVKHGKDCVFDLHGSYEDGSTTDMPGVDLCKEKTFNLVD